MSPILPFVSHVPYLILRHVSRKVALQTALQPVPLSLLAHTYSLTSPPICQSFMRLSSFPSASLPSLAPSVYLLSSAHPPFPSTHVLVALINHPRTEIIVGLPVGRELWSGPWGRDRLEGKPAVTRPSKSPGVVPASATRGRLVLFKALEAAHQHLQFLQWFPREQASRKQGGTFSVPLNS